ncbi:MAG: CsgG/HfaB family protein, partial [Planctomycetota bacterium]
MPRPTTTAALVHDRQRLPAVFGLVAATVLIAFTVATRAQDESTEAAAGKATLGVDRVGVTDGIEEAVLRQGDNAALSLRRFTDSLEQHLIDRFQTTRKFEIVARNDLAAIIDDQQIQQTYSDPTDAKKAELFRIAGAEFLLIVTIDDFEDRYERFESEGGEVAERRSVRASAIAKIYDTTAGTLLESVAFNFDAASSAQRLNGNVRAVGGIDRFGELLAERSRELADAIAISTLNELFPAKVVAVNRREIIINRGEGTGIEAGDRWTILATGDELIDPDTGESL